MSCSKAHGPQAFVRYVKDMTGETITQQDWHDVRKIAGAQGADMGRGHVSAAEAIASLQALSARMKSDEIAAKATNTPPKSADELAQELLAEGEAGWEKVHSDFQSRMFVHSEKARRSPSLPDASRVLVEPAHPLSREGESEGELMSAKVTRGTVAVIRFFATYGVKPVLAYVRAHREEQKRMKKAAKQVQRYQRMAAGR